MIAWYEYLILGIYLIALSLLFLYSLGQLHLAIKYLQAKEKTIIPHAVMLELPRVTIQLPVYNEKYVVERLIDAVCKIQYPLDLLEIQVLDDSEDETSALITNKVSEYRHTGIDIVHLTRKDRKNFKAGALTNGLAVAKGEFIAIFDADFTPTKNYLLSTIHNFTDPKVGMVQTRWGHINRDFSFLTRMQAFGLDAHFTVEQTGRSSAGSFINFNGTGGIWRRTCIEEAGGWSADTLTEDLDLSYRAQLKGWHFKYLEAIESPAELPIIMPAIKSQQYRWNKGAAETSIKNLGKVYSQKLPFTTKIHATFHLLNSSVFLLLMIVALLSLPLLLIKFNHPQLYYVFRLANLFLLGFFSIAFYFWVASKRARFTTIKENFARMFISFMTLSMGLSWHNSMAVIEGLLGYKTPFIRTPKFNATNTDAGAKNNTYTQYSLDVSSIIEMALGFYFIAAIFLGIYLQDYGLIAFHSMLALGFMVVSYQSLRLWHVH